MYPLSISALKRAEGERRCPPRGLQVEGAGGGERGREREKQSGWSREREREKGRRERDLRPVAAMQHGATGRPVRALGSSITHR